MQKEQKEKFDKLSDSQLNAIRTILVLGRMASGMDGDNVRVQQCDRLLDEIDEYVKMNRVKIITVS